MGGALLVNIPLFVIAGTAAWMLAGVALASALGPRLRRCGELAGGAEDGLSSQPGGGGRRGLARWTLPGSVAAFAFASSTGLAAAGVLPHPAQGVARTVLSSVRLEVPAAPDDQDEPEVAVPRSGDGPSSEASGSEPSPDAGEARAEVAPEGPGASSSTGAEPAGLAEPRVDDASAQGPEPAARSGDDSTVMEEGAVSNESQDPARPGVVNVAPPRGRPATAPARSQHPAGDPGIPAVGGAPGLSEELDDTSEPGAPEGGPDVAGEGRGAPAAPPATPSSEDPPSPPGSTPGRPVTPARPGPPPSTPPDHAAAPVDKPDTPAPGPPPGTRPDHPPAPAGKPDTPARPGSPPGRPLDPLADRGGRGRPAHAGPGAAERPGHPQHPLGTDRSHPGRGKGLPELPAPAAADTPQTSLPESTGTVTAQLEG